MLEIVFNESVLGSMEQAAINATHRKPENLFCFPLPLDRGDIQKDFAVAREPLAALLAQAKDTPLRIWSSDAPQEKCGLYWLVAQLEPLGWENLDVSLVELPAFLEREDGVVSNTVRGAKCARRNGAAGRRRVFGSPLPCCGPWPTVGRSCAGKTRPSGPS